MRSKNTAVSLESPAVIAVDPFLAKAEKNRLLAGLHGLEVHVLGVDSAGERRSPIGTVCGTSGLDIFVRAAMPRRALNRILGRDSVWDM